MFKKVPIDVVGEDLRRAVIITDIVYLILLIIQAFLYYILYNVMLTLNANVVAADKNDDFDDYVDVTSSVRKMMTITWLEMVFVGVVIQGAINFEASKLFVGIITYSIVIFVRFACALTNLVGLLMEGFFVLPHLILYQEMRVSTGKGRPL